MSKCMTQHERLFRIAEELDQLADEIDDDHDRRIIEGAAWDVNSMAKVRREVRALAE